ncbi:MAG TPA: aminotransferase class I/II-fold pyridoxal phosphate-dependent enzyme [Hyalangium sp.]|nr:aminotransferase class I/II-fold pyridoxal phosphate-dependent enzyme [Hyalangium sp.]
MSSIPRPVPPQEFASTRRLRIISSQGLEAWHPSPGLRAIRREIRQLERYVPPFTDRTRINLSLNEHPAPPPPAIAEALEGFSLERLVTYDQDQADHLRSLLAEREGVSPDNILLCPGSSHGLALLFSCLGGGPVLFPSLCWSYYPNLARLNALPVGTYDVLQREETFEIDPLSVERALRQEEVSLLLFINPHMPTGALTGSDLILRCAAHARDTLVLVDEAYHGFSAEADSVASQVTEHPNIVVSKTFSKYFGLASIRVGYLVSSRQVIEQLEKMLSPFSLAPLSTAIACAALESEPYYREQAAVLMAVQEAFRQRMATLPGVRPYRSHGNFLLVDMESAEEAQQAEARVHAAGMAVRSARSYGLPSFLRVSVGTAEAMDRVAVALAARGGDHVAR